MSASLQTSFADALLDADGPIPHGVMAHNAAPARRFGVYRNNVDDRMRDLMATLSRVAMSDVCVLIQGETGTGKDRISQALHRASPRRTGRAAA